jgi:hypothetical protein
MSKKSKVKVTKSVEENMLAIIKTIIKIYEIKSAEQLCKGIIIDDKNQQNKDNLNSIQSNLREVLNNFHYQAKALYENPEYEGRRTRTNYVDEFLNKEPKILKRYAYFDLERILIEDYMDCKNRPVKKGILKMIKAKRKFQKVANNYTKKTKTKKAIVNA